MPISGGTLIGDGPGLCVFRERTFHALGGIVDHNRRMTKDYERLTETSEAFIYVAMSRLMVKRLARS